MINQLQIRTLKAHLENIRTAQSFKEFKAIQIKYVELLIKDCETREDLNVAVDEYVGKTMQNHGEWKVVERAQEE